MYLIYEMLQHFFSHLKISNYPILQRSNGRNISGSSAQHSLGICSNGSYRFLTIVCSNCDHRRFVQNDALVLDIHQSVGRTEVDGHVLRTEFEQVGKEAHYSEIP